MWAQRSRDKQNYSQKTFIFKVVSLIPLLTSSFVARQTKFLPLSCLVGVNSRVDVVMLPSGDVYELIIKSNGERKNSYCKDIKNIHVISCLNRAQNRAQNKD